MNENEDVNHSYSISHPPPGYRHTPLDLAILRQGDPADAFYAEAERNKERAGSEPQLTRGDDGQADGGSKKLKCSLYLQKNNGGMKRVFFEIWIIKQNLT